MKPRSPSAPNPQNTTTPGSNATPYVVWNTWYVTQLNRRSSCRAPDRSSFYTDNVGNVIGVPDPIVTPSVLANLVSGTLAVGTYHVKIAYAGAGGVSNASPEATVILSSQGSIIVSAPVQQPASATGYAVYISARPGRRRFRERLRGGRYTRNPRGLTSGATLPSVNSSVCSIRFSDELIPTGTYYTVTLTSARGSKIAGLPADLVYVWRLWRDD